MSLKLNPNAPHYYPSKQMYPYRCFFPVAPRVTLPFLPFSFPPFPFETTHPFLFKTRPLWVPNETLKYKTSYLSFERISVCSIPSGKTSDLEFVSNGDKIEGKTSIMIKNIPIKLTREMLIEMLDQLCAELEKHIKSEFDFVYLPVDFSTGFNRGYAFVNFTTPNAAKKAYDQIHHRKWNVFSSNKVAHICYARIQGKEALIYRFWDTKFWEYGCNTDEFHPVIFTPPRNGTTSLPLPRVIGRRRPY